MSFFQLFFFFVLVFIAEKSQAKKLLELVELLGCSMRPGNFQIHCTTFPKYSPTWTQYYLWELKMRLIQLRNLVYCVPRTSKQFSVKDLPIIETAVPIIVSVLHACNFTEKVLNGRSFSVNFLKYLRADFLQNTSWRLLLL